MTERQEVQLRRQLSIWKNRQNLAGRVLALCNCCAIALLILVVMSPSPISKALLGIAIIATVVIGFRLLFCASQAASIQGAIQGNVVDVEVVDPGSKPGLDSFA